MLDLAAGDDGGRAAHLDGDRRADRREGLDPGVAGVAARRPVGEDQAEELAATNLLGTKKSLKI